MLSAGPIPVSATTRLCAVYGHPIRHSASPAMQNAGIAALGLDWCYVACEVPPSDLRTALAGAAAMRFVGVNLTVPHKLLAMEIMDVLDDSARRWGAVNTVRFEGLLNGAWVPLAEIPPESASQVRMHGFNTDADAIVSSLAEELGLTLRGNKVLLLGAGGAGRVAALRLAAEGVDELWLVNRTEGKARDLADEIARSFPSTRVQLGYPTGEVDLVLNATSAGLKADDPLPFDSTRWDMRRTRTAYDMIYRPAETRFLREAKMAGCCVANGFGMLLHQGAAALEIWSGRKAPVEVMRDALRRNIYGPSA